MTEKSCAMPYALGIEEFGFSVMSIMSIELLKNLHATNYEARDIGLTEPKINSIVRLKIDFDFEYRLIIKASK